MLHAKSANYKANTPAKLLKTMYINATQVMVATIL